jgi:excinuclease UvrABC helicase subunit UvrB
LAWQQEDYSALIIPLRVGQQITREQLLSQLVDLQYPATTSRSSAAIFGSGVTRSSCVRPMRRTQAFEFFGERLANNVFRSVDRKQNAIFAIRRLSQQKFATPMDKIKRAVMTTARN